VITWWTEQMQNRRRTEDSRDLGEEGWAIWP